MSQIDKSLAKILKNPISISLIVFRSVFLPIFMLLIALLMYDTYSTQSSETYINRLVEVLLNGQKTAGVYP